MVPLGPDLGLLCDDHHMVPLLNLFSPCPVNSNGVFGLYVMIDCRPGFLPSLSEQGRAKALGEGEPRMGAEPNSSLSTTGGGELIEFYYQQPGEPQLMLSLHMHPHTGPRMDAHAHIGDSPNAKTKGYAYACTIAPPYLHAYTQSVQEKSAQYI